MRPISSVVAVQFVHRSRPSCCAPLVFTRVDSGLRQRGAVVQSRSLSTTPSVVHQPSFSHSASSPSVNSSEVSHFDALASTWWDPYGSSRILHLMNPLRHDFIRRCQISSPTTTATALHQQRYLDVGCGGGIFAESAARMRTTAAVTAIDPSPEVLSIARRHARKDPMLAAKLKYLNTSIEMLEETLDKQGQCKPLYDVVTVFEVVEHVDAPAVFLDRCGALVRPGGWLILSTIARTWMSWVTTKLVAEDILGIVPKGTHNWRKYVNEDELRRHFAKRDHVWERPRGMGVVYVPGLGWKEMGGSEKVGNYFFGVQRTV